MPYKYNIYYVHYILYILYYDIRKLIYPIYVEVKSQKHINILIYNIIILIYIIIILEI